MQDLSKKTILVIEDDYTSRNRISACLEMFNFNVLQAKNVKDGINYFRAKKPDLILADLTMTELDGKTVITTVAAESPETPVIVVSGAANIADAVDTVRMGAWDFILKPFNDVAILIHSILKAFERAELLKNNRIYQEKLENYKKIMDQDLKMAINVQKNYLVTKTPDSRDWDVAFEYQPMGGISGDFYDFYENAGKLVGLSIFDVSGHGIASGLITMLAKSIVLRCFKSMHNLPLNDVIENINHELINELDNIGNYLTGVILKFNENSVDYVNAAHPTILHRISKTGKIIKPGMDEDFVNGSFLGMRTVAGKYNLNTFNVERNDLILLFTDCLIDAVSPENKRYGIDKLVNVFKNVPRESSCRDALNYVLNDFYSFTKTASLPDDLTVILIKKK